jgi:hypothetical protein
MASGHVNRTKQAEQMAAQTAAARVKIAPADPDAARKLTKGELPGCPRRSGLSAAEGRPPCNRMVPRIGLLTGYPTAPASACKALTWSSISFFRSAA